MKRISSWLVVGGALAALGAPTPGLAKEDDKSVNEKILDILLEKGDISKQRYEELREEALEEQRTATTAAATPPVSSGSGSGLSVKYDNGVKISGNVDVAGQPRKVKFQIGGRIHYDTAASSLNSRLKDMFPDAEGFGNDFRRARLFVSGESENFFFKTQYDFAGGDTDFNDVYVGFQKKSAKDADEQYRKRLRIGHYKEAATLEGTTSSKYNVFMERGLPVLAFWPGRNAGIGFDKTLFDQRATVAVTLFDNVGSDGENFDNQSGFNTSVRVTGIPWESDDGKDLVHVGGWWSHQFRGDDPLRYNPDAESNTVGSLLNMPTLQVDDVDLLGAELAALCGPWFFQSEFIASLVDGYRSRDQEFYGHYVTAGYFLGGRRSYKRADGAFGRPKVDEAFSLNGDGWGALELAVRYSHLSLNDSASRGGILNDFTVGANWYLYRNLRLMVNYVLAHRNGVGDAHIAQSRVSIDF